MPWRRIRTLGRTAIRKLVRIAELSARQRVTRTGLVFTAAATLVGLAAFASANNLLFLVLAAMVSTILVSGLVSRLTLVGLELALELPEHIVAGHKIPATVAVRNAKRWMPSFSVRLTATGSGSLPEPVEFPVIGGRKTVSAPIDLCFERRGSYRDNRFLFSTGFPFGFAERRIPVHLNRQVIVYPPVGGSPELDELLNAASSEMEAIARGLGHDFYRIRPYEALESARHVDWRATAHTGDVQVREFSRDEEPALEIWLDCDVHDGEEAWFERAVECCAYLAWRLRERASRLRLRTWEYDCATPRDGSIYDILRYLALVSPAAGQALPPREEMHGYRIVISRTDDRQADPRTRFVSLG